MFNWAGSARWESVSFEGARWDSFSGASEPTTTCIQGKTHDRYTRSLWFFVFFVHLLLNCIDTSTLKDYDILDNTKIYLSIKKEEVVKELTVQETLNRELKEFGRAHFQDADKFVETFNKVIELALIEFEIFKNFFLS